jgi:2-polyprenyl-3-methyl-5-hydroxy-6-metoxy-1,4-benzoquinol methylase
MINEKGLKKIEKLLPLDRRIPLWHNNRLQHRNCPFCLKHSNNTIYQRPDLLAVDLCLNCNTYFINPTPNDLELDSFYSEYHSKYYDEKIESVDQTLSSLNSSSPLDDIRIQTLMTLMDLSKAKILDIGCGKGRFLYQLKQLKAEVYGIEIDKDAVKFASLLGINNVFTGNFESFESNQRFDLIILNDIIEHPINPYELLRKAVELLNKDGLILIWTPNGDRIETDIDKVTLRVDLEHLQYLGFKAVKHFTQIFPLDVIHFETIGFPNLQFKLEKSPRITTKSIINMKKIIYGIPGFKFLNGIRQLIISNNNINKKASLRIGNYNLFCILKKTS